MSKRVFRTTTTAVIFAILFSVAGSAAAADFTPRGTSAAKIGFDFDLGQVWTWLTNAWTDFEKAFAQDSSNGGGTTTPPPATSSTCDPATNAGCGIDPNG